MGSAVVAGPGEGPAGRALSKPARRLLAAAMELFYRQGARSTTVREITAACGLSPGALYNHFTSKDELVYILVRSLHSELEARVAAAQEAAGGDPVEELAAIVRVYISVHAQARHGSRVANRDYRLLSGPQRDEIVAIRRGLRDRLAAVLVEGHRRGLFELCGGADPTSAHLVAATILEMCIEISEWFHESGPLSLEELQGRYVEMALRVAGARSRLSR